MTKVNNIPWRTSSSWVWVIEAIMIANMMFIVFSCIYWGFARTMHYSPLDKLLGGYWSNSRFINSTNEDLVVTLMGGNERSGRWPLRCGATGWKFRINHFPVKSGEEVEFDYQSGFLSNDSPDCWVIEDSKGNLYEALYRRWATSYVDDLEDLSPASPELIRDRRKPIAGVPARRLTDVLIPLAGVAIQVILIVVYLRLRRRKLIEITPP